ncbi:gluconate 5-dehydrogenase [Shimia isoporae]|uniref:Gluconate 5-dehydrogenase n=1 Tax=Shimia isoporae TaxID=647720 RepID=A0A4R1NQZ3_9RHOB|nr:SDR family oxidoreductase [Shimia isoporae]TCL10299.1 gluconate 5-dehydrogenase [Shimia isoporae]
MTGSPFDLDGKIALITGGGSGIGFGIAQCFVNSGARVLLIGQTESKLAAAVEQLGDSARYFVADVTNEAACRSAVDCCVDMFGGLDILINNAGNHLKKSLLETSQADVQSVLDVHVLAAFNLTRLALPALAEREGSVLFIASMASYLSIPQVIGYTAAKSAVLGLVRGTAAEAGPMGVRANAIAPGWISSAMTDAALNNDPPRKAKILSRTPLGGMGEPSDIGWAATYLSSRAAKFVTGQVLAVDGGAVSGF